MKSFTALVFVATALAWDSTQAADTTFPADSETFHVTAAVSVAKGHVQRMLPKLVDVLLTGPLNIVSNSGPDAKIVTQGSPPWGEGIWKVEPGGGLLFRVSLPPNAQHAMFEVKVMVFDQQPHGHQLFFNVNGDQRYLTLAEHGIIKTLHMGKELPAALKSGENLIEVSNFDNVGAIGVQALIVDFDLPRYRIDLPNGGQISLISPLGGQILADQERGVLIEWKGKGASKDSGVALQYRTEDDPRWRPVPRGEALTYNNSDGRSNRGSWVWHPTNSAKQFELQLKYLDPAKLSKRLCKYRTPLHDLSRELSLSPKTLKSRFNLLLSAGCNIDARLPFQRGKNLAEAPLHNAVRYGNIPMIELLLENGAYVHAETRSGVQPIHFAKKLEIVKMLVKHGSNPKARAPNGITPLLVSALRGHLEIAKFLIETGGVNVNEEYRSGTTSLHLVAQRCERRDSVNFAKLLMSHGADRDAKSNRKLKARDALNHVIMALSPMSRTPLHNTIIYCNGNRVNQLAMIKTLTAGGPRIEFLTKKGYSSLILAIVNNKTDASIAQQLIERGAAPHRKFFDCSLLWAAIRYAKNRKRGVSAKVRLLIKALPSIVNVPCRDHFRTAIYAAVSNGNIDTVEFLISKNAEVNFPKFSLLSVTKDPQMIRLLKRYGAK